MKRLLLILNLLSCNTFFSQVTGEGTGTFFEEITDLLLKTDKQKVKKINIEANSFWDPGARKAMCNNKTSFEFLNDSIVKQKFQRKTYLLKLKNKNIIEAEYEKQFSLNESDSANFKIYKTTYINETDTVIYINRMMYSSDRRLMQEINTSNRYKQNNLNTIDRYEYEGDSIRYKRHFILKNKEWVLSYEEKEVAFSKNGLEHKTYYTILYKKDTGEKDWVKLQLTNYLFDKKDTTRITRIEKFDYFNNEPEWSQKNILTVNYKLN